MRPETPAPRTPASEAAAGRGAFWSMASWTGSWMAWGAAVLVAAIAALAVGAVFAVLTSAVGESPFPADTAAYYLEQSYPAALGRNVVNTILVDFRALDTLGEVLVIAAAGLGVLVLLGARRGASGRDGA